MKLLDALQVKTRTYDLAVPLQNGMTSAPVHPSFHMALVRRHGDRKRPGGGTSANELITTGGHVGTHIDALCHVALDGKMCGGVIAEEAVRGGKFSKLGIETIEPMLTRGVLLDIPKLLGKTRLDPGYGVTKEDCEKALGDLPLNKGDVALIRTGWIQLFGDAHAYLGDSTGVPGITEGAATWLAEHGVRAAGADTIAFDQIHSPDTLARPAHGVLLFYNGIHIIEVMDLEELAADGVREFFFVCAPLKLMGATGCPIRPLAVVEV